MLFIYSYNTNFFFVFLIYNDVYSEYTQCCKKVTMKELENFDTIGYTKKYKLDILNKQLLLKET